MAKGEKTFNLGDVQKSKRSFEPFPAGDYDLKLRGQDVEIRKADSKDGKPTFSYVSLAFDALGTGKDGGKDRRVYHMLFLRLKPGKDGLVSPALADGLKGLADALGDTPNLPTVEQNGEDIINPKAVVQFLKNHDGNVVRAHVSIQRGNKQYPGDKNKVDEFFAADEEGGGSEGEEVEELEELEEEPEEEVEEVEEIEEEPPLPPKKVVKKVVKRR